MPLKRDSRESESTGELYDDRSRYGDGELILRDYLAVGRTDLANERTLLAYIRTALAVTAAGVTIVHFFESMWLDIIGWVLVPIGVATLVLGIVRYRRMKERIRSLRA